MTGEQFRNYRKQLGWSQQDLAAWGGVSRRTIIRFERDQQPIPEIWTKAVEMLTADPERIRQFARERYLVG